MLYALLVALVLIMPCCLFMGLYFPLPLILLVLDAFHSLLDTLFEVFTCLFDFELLLMKLGLGFRLIAHFFPEGCGLDVLPPIKFAHDPVQLLLLNYLHNI